MLRELNSLLAESSRVSKEPSSADAASLDMQNLSLTSTRPPVTTNNTFAASNDSPSTSSTALDAVASQDTTQHVSGSLDHQHDADASNDSHPAPSDQPSPAHDATAPDAHKFSPSDARTSPRPHAHTSGVEEVTRGDGQDAGRTSERNYDLAEGDDEDDEDDGDSDSVLDFQPQELMVEEAHRVVASTTVLLSTFTTIKGDSLSPCVCTHCCWHCAGV